MGKRAFRSWFGRRRSWWGVIAVLSYIAGTAIAFTTSITVLDQGTTPDELNGVVTSFVVVGILVAGGGQLMRAAAHGATSKAGRRVDGWGKSVGLFGWSLGLMGAVFSAISTKGTPDWVFPFVILAVVLTFSGALVFAARLLVTQESSPPNHQTATQGPGSASVLIAIALAYRHRG